MKLGFDVSKDAISPSPRLKGRFSGGIKTEPEEASEKAKKKEFSIRTSHTELKFLIKSAHEGGMGIVYIAEKETDRKLYALKTVREVSEAFIKRFKWESQVWIILGKHRNIVQAHWFDEISGRPLLIMECIEGDRRYGSTLHGWLRKTTLNVPTVLDVAIQSCTGLLYAQRMIKEELNMSFVHRDLKPSNIMITKDGIVEVTDFGLVKAFTDIDGNIELRVKDDLGERVSVLKTGGICGTPPYMAPEQWLAEEPDERTDIYALGCILYEMIRGRPPFLGPTKELLMKQHLEEIPAPPERTAEKIPEGLSRIIMKCLEKKRERRIQTFHELRERLQEINETVTGKRLDVKDEPEELNAKELNDQGNGFRSLGFLQKAINCYEKALEIDPRYAVAHNNLGSAYYNKGMLDDAITCYKNAIEIDPRYRPARYNLRLAYYKKGMPEEAIKSFENFIKFAPPQYARRMEEVRQALSHISQLRGK